MSEGGRVPGRSERVYRALLKVYPRAFREEYGAQMEQLFGDVCRREENRAGMGGLVALWMRTVADLVVSAAVERGRTVAPALTSSGMIRFGGLAAMVGGALSAVLVLRNFAMVFWVGYGSPAWLFGALDLVGVLASMLIAVATLGLYACVAVGSRKLATVGLVVATLSAVMLAGALIYESTAAPTSGYVANSEVSAETFAIALGVVGLVYTIGFLLLGVAVILTRALGRWSPLPLILGLFPPVGHLLILLLAGSGGQLEGTQIMVYMLTSLPSVFVDLGWVLLGYVLWSGWSRGAEEPTPAA